MIDQVCPTLKLIVEKLEQTTVAWAVFGSMALMLHGIHTEPQDIDILTDSEGVDVISDLFKNEQIKSIEKRPSDIWDSYLGTFLMNDIEVEVMRSLKVRSCLDNQWYCLQHLLELRQFVTVDDVVVPVVPLQQLLSAYKKAGRQKDLVRIQMAKDKGY